MMTVKSLEDKLYFLRINKLKAKRKIKKLELEIKSLNYQIAMAVNQQENEKILLQRGDE